MTLPFKNEIEIWNAINRYTETCGGDTSKKTISGERMNAVVKVNKAIMNCIKEIKNEKNTNNR